MQPRIKRIIAIVSGLVLALAVTFALRVAGLTPALAGIVGGLVGFGDYLMIMFVLSRRPE